MGHQIGGCGVNVLLSGIVGSTAYGLAGPDSDIDRLGIYAAPSTDFFGLGKVRESVVLPGGELGDDFTNHELGKFCRLALGANPTVMELLWLPEELYEIRSKLGNELIDMRTRFLSAKRVREAYLGYASQQFHKLELRGDGSFSADTRKRTSKHARHLLRLLHQGSTLYNTGKLLIRLDDPEKYIEFGERVAAGDIESARYALRRTQYMFENSRGNALPELPDTEAINSWLTVARIRLMTGAAND